MSFFSGRTRNGPVEGRRPRLAVVSLESRDVPTTQLFATGSGPGGPPIVIVHDASNNTVGQITAYDARFTGGVSVATGDVNGDGVADIITGAQAGGGPHVKVF